MLYRRILNGSVAESESRAEFSLSCDVLVAGLGTAGAVAAIAAARSRLDVIGVEALGSMGGTGTAGCVWDYSWGSSGGQFEEIDRRAQELGDRLFLHTGEEGCELGSRFIHGSAKSYELALAAKEAGCRLLFNTSLTGVFVEGDSIVGVECAGINGAFNIAVRVVIDSTGDLIAARSFGLPTRSSPDSVRMNFSKTMVVMNGRIARNYAAPCGPRYSGLRDDFRLSERLVEVGSRPGFLRDSWSAANRVVISGELPGYRDCARIYGLSTLSLNGLLTGAQETEPLFCAFSPIDHVGGDMLEAPFELKLWRIGCKLRGFGLNIPIPLGVMLPEGVDNLIVAGKGISVSDELTGCLRMKKDMEKLGEAAAVIADEMLLENVPARGVDLDKVRGKLLESGCLADCAQPFICRVNGFMDRTPILPPETREELIELVGSKSFGALTILALRGMFDPARLDELLSLPETTRNAAIVLGTLGLFGREVPEKALEILRALALEPVADDSSAPKDGEDTRDPDALLPAAAVWILGELADPRSVSVLKALEARLATEQPTRAAEFMKGLRAKALAKAPSK